MTSQSIIHFRKELENQISYNFALIDSLVKIRDIHKRLKIKPELSSANIYLVLELTFLKIFIAWEQFLESSFIGYMLGGSTSRGPRITRYVYPADKDHALRILCGPGKEYTRWTSVNEIIARSELFFKKGKPFKGALSSRESTINEMQTIRNCLAHMSSDSFKKFKNLVRNKLRGGYFPSGTTPGKFLYTKNRLSSPKVTFLEYYANILNDAAKEIIP
jgi:hypothetical protein